MEVIATVIVFSLCMMGLGAGVIMAHKGLRGTCGSDPLENRNGDAISCGACPKKEAEVCASDDPLVALAQIGNPSRDLQH